MTKEQERLVIDNHKLIYEYMWKHHMYEDDVEDWYGLCAIGLCKAALIYTPAKGVQFSTLAYMCMYNSCRKRRERAYNESLQDVTNIVDRSAFERICPDLSYDPYIDKELKIYIENVLPRYKEKAQQMIRMKLYQGLTFEQIGKIFNCTKQNVQSVWDRFCKRVKNDLYV